MDRTESDLIPWLGSQKACHRDHLKGLLSTFVDKREAARSGQKEPLVGTSGQGSLGAHVAGVAPRGARPGP